MRIVLERKRRACRKGSEMTEGGVVAVLSRRIAAGECVFAAWVGINEPMIAEQLARDGFDTAVMEMQHGSVDVTGALRGISAVALAGKPAIVRIPIGDFATASRVIDAGAAAVIAPMINNAADARQFAAFIKFPPLGQRSWGPRAALALTGYEPSDYLRNANQITLAVAMVETREAIAALDEILATPGIDGVFVGPSDLSIALSDGGAVEAQSKDVDAALTKIVASAKAHGKFAAAFCHTGERAQDLARRGFSLCSVSTDQLLLRLAARQELAKARATST
jgi:4-hydroxy-2-oxoheptanedioate aldolase